MELSDKKRLPVHRAVEAVEKAITDVPIGDPSFGDERYKSSELKTEHFHPLPKAVVDRKFAFVDGGSAELLNAPNLAIGLTRVYAGIFRGDKRVEPVNIPSKIDFFTVCYASVASNRIVYKTDLVPVREEWRQFLPDRIDLEFNSFDPTLMSGFQRVVISRILDVARAFAEWRFAKIIIDQELARDDVIVRDGTLQTVVTNESKYANETYDAALNRGVYLTSISKTSSLFTDMGQPLFPSIQILSETSALKDSAWYYYPIVEITHPDHKAEMFAIRLHECSDYVFRFEVFKDQVSKHDLGEVELILSSLAANSRDVGFPGYPYGLIDADRFARISMNEKSVYEFQFLAALSSNKNVWNKVSKYLRSSDAHDILNKMIK